MSYAEFAFLDPKVAKQVCLDENLSIVSLPPANTKLFFTCFPIYREEVEHIPWPIGLHKTKDEWINVKADEKAAVNPDYVTIDSDEEPMPPGEQCAVFISYTEGLARSYSIYCFMFPPSLFIIYFFDLLPFPQVPFSSTSSILSPPGDIPMPTMTQATPPPAVAATRASAPKDVSSSKESTPVPGEPTPPPSRKRATRESTPATGAINAFGDQRGHGEDEPEEDAGEQQEEEDRKSRAKALLAAALKKRQTDGSGADDANNTGASNANKAKRTIYVRGFMDDPSQAVKLDVFKFFKQFGKVANVTLGYSKEQGLQYTWAAVEMEDDSVIKDLIRTNLFLDGFPLHLSRKKDNWDADTAAAASKLDSSLWRHAYVTGLSDGVSADEIQRFLDAKVGGIKRVDSRAVNSLSIFLVEFESNAACLRALKGGSFSFLGDIFLWPPYVYEDLCVRKQTFDQQLAGIQGLSELPPKKLIYQCLVVQKLETQLKAYFPDCSMRIAGDALARLLPSERLELYFEFTPSDSDVYRDNKAPKVSLDDVREGSVNSEMLAQLPAHARLQLLSSALEELGVAETYRVTAPTTKRKGSLNFRHAASSLNISIGVAKTTENERTALLQLMQQHDARFAPIYFAFRHFLHVWAKIDSRVASYSPTERMPTDIVILIMTMVYLQQVQPPVLPSIRELQALTEETHMVEGWNCAGGLISPTEIPRAETNDASVLTLLSGLFQFYANFDFDNFVLSPYYGKSVPFSLLFVPQVPGQEDLFKIGTKMNVQDIFALNRNLTLDIKVGEMSGRRLFNIHSIWSDAVTDALLTSDSFIHSFVHSFIHSFIASSRYVIFSQSSVRDAINNGCTKGYAALSDPDIEDSTLFNQVVWGYPLVLNEHVSRTGIEGVDVCVLQICLLAKSYPSSKYIGCM